jgi:hypothetical protein
MDYHTALRPDENSGDRPQVRFWERPGVGMAFVHDVNLGLPEEMSRCDFIYAELPWRDGYQEFLRRAGKELSWTYERWLFKLGVSLIRFGKPYVMVAAHAAARHLPCEWVKPCDLNGSQAVALGGFCSLSPAFTKTAEDILRRLVVRSVSEGKGIIGDPCAGFGRTARIANEFGCQFICTDINPGCIGTIAAEFI